MEFRAHLKNVHMSPRKMRLVRSVICGLAATDAAAQLTFMPGKASNIVLKVLRSAMANARHNFDADEASLVVEDVVINAGMRLKRWRPVSKGMAHPIQKRMSHVTVILEERGVGTTPAKKPKKTEIADISAEDHVRQSQEEIEEKVAPTGNQAKKPERQKLIPDKQQKAYQKMKIQQQGGDRAKAIRRKSPSEGK